MLDDDISIADWNTRGLNDPDRRTTVHNSLAASACHIACIQESKLSDIDPSTAAYVGGYRLSGFAQRPAIGTRGGILILWDCSHISVSHVVMGDFFLSATVTIIHTGVSFKLTSVYGPTANDRKEDFFAELLAEKPLAGVK
jgi:exonuclease III